MNEENNEIDQSADEQRENKIDPKDMELENFSEKDEEPSFSFVKKTGLLIFEVIKVVLISLAIILPIRLFLVQPFYVEGASMEPNFFQNEYLIIDEISYRFNEPQRGEVIIFKSPQDSRSYFIKRVIGLPGEKVKVKDGRIFINGQELAEVYINNFSSEDNEEIIIAQDEYFVLGDNRINSLDSRSFGPIKKTSIIGRVWVRGWPVNRFNTFNLPEYK
ncbi:MAG: signal peptidase I [bacterium]|nr:signal peptidase I [bacterium]